MSETNWMEGVVVRLTPFSSHFVQQPPVSNLSRVDRKD
jgi:hypothetical protein